MGRARANLVAAVRQDLSIARGAARAVLAAAESARAEAHRHSQVVREAYATCLVQLAGARDAARLDVLRRFHRESTSLSGNVESLAANCAAGAAGASWRTWEPTEPEPGRQPGLLRIGMISYDSPAPPGHRAPPRRTVLPALVPLLDQAHLELTGEPAAVDAVVAGLLLRALGSTHAGDIRLSLFDPEHLGRALAGFAPLAGAGLLTDVGPGGLGALLDDLVEHLQRVDAQLLAGQFGSLGELAAADPGRPTEPWRVAVLLVDAATAADVTAAQAAQLAHIVRTGVARGVHLIVRGLPMVAHPSVERILVSGPTATSDTTGELPVRLDSAPPADRVSAFCHELARRWAAGPPQAHLTDLEPEKSWTESAADGLTGPLGVDLDGALVDVSLGDDPAHALIGGPAGAGKTNLIYAWLAALATRYGPDELAIFLLDFRDGGSFARFVTSPREPSWLPQVRLVGVNLGTDREFGRSVLRNLDGELRRRVRAGRRHETTTLAGLRAADPLGRWPRIMAVIDDFPTLVSGGDPVATDALGLLAKLARHGRAQGIHLVLAAPDGPGVEALRRTPGLLDEFALRLALPRARGVLAPDNLAADVIGRCHVVVNARAGLAGANRVVRLPDAGDRTRWRSLQEKLWHARPDGLTPPRLFDGEAVPTLSRPVGVTGADPVAVLGECVEVGRRPATMAMGRTAGRNLAVLGTRADEACDVLATAALSLAEQGPARFTVACLDPVAATAAGALLGALPHARWFDRDTVAELLGELAGELTAPGAAAPHYVIGYAWDAVTERLAVRPRAGQPSGRERLRSVLTQGPARGVHLLGWWRGVFGLRGDLGGRGATLDPIGGWVALDVPGDELRPLSPESGGADWQPRRRRALYFDRSVHRSPAVLVPYRVELSPEVAP